MQMNRQTAETTKSIEKNIIELNKFAETHPDEEVREYCKNISKFLWLFQRMHRDSSNFYAQISKYLY